MTRKILVITDTHLTDVASEEYRWRVFDFVREELGKGGYTDLFHLGDVFDKKDRHKAGLVNRLVNELLEISETYCPTTIMSGNHCYVVDREECFLRFLDKFDNITWIDKPTYWDEAEILFLPHSRTPEDEWSEWLDVMEKDSLKFIFMHQSIIGANVSNYHELNCGLDPNFFNDVSATIVSGDIHVPQELRRVNYIGTQHPVSFGDSYQPRMLRLDGTDMTWININTIKREHIKKEVLTFKDLEVEFKKLRPKDQVKVTVQLDKNQLHEWADYKKKIINYCKENSIELHDLKMEKVSEGEMSDEMQEYIKANMKSLSSKDVLLKFAGVEKIGESLLNVGLKLFGEENES